MPAGIHRRSELGRPHHHDRSHNRLDTTTTTTEATTTTTDSTTTTEPASDETTTTTAPIPDLTPTIDVTPEPLVNGGSSNLAVQISEVNGVDTTGPVTVRVTKDIRWTFGSFPSNADNDKWTLDASGTSYVFTTSETIPANGSLPFAMQGVWDAGATTGTATFSVNIESGSGGEGNFSNNNNADSVPYALPTTTTTATTVPPSRSVTYQPLCENNSWQFQVTNNLNAAQQITVKKYGTTGTTQSVGPFETALITPLDASGQPYPVVAPEAGDTYPFTTPGSSFSSEVTSDAGYWSVVRWSYVDPAGNDGSSCGFISITID